MSFAQNFKISIKQLTKKVFLFGRLFYYHGSTVECPICNHGFRKMLPGGFHAEVINKLEVIGAGYRLHNICPYCLSTDRDRLVFLYLKNRTQFFNISNRVLHISPEPSLYRVLKKATNLTYLMGTKYAEGSYYPAGISFFDLLSIPYPDNNFDVIICNHVLEHIEDDKQATSELFRVLKPGGYAILQVPISNKIEKTIEDFTIIKPEERHEAFGQFDHVRVYGPDYKERLEAVGFFVTKQSPYTQEWNINHLTKYALNKKEELYIAHKSPKQD